MAQQVLVQLVDDLNGTSSDDVSTVLFGLDGVTYEIDLSEANAERLRTNLADFAGAARRVGGRLKRGTTSNSAGAGSTGEAAETRKWAQENGYDLSNRGRIPSHVVDAYHQAQADKKVGKTKPARSTTRRGGARARTTKS
jgi:hypothetical protein